MMRRNPQKQGCWRIWSLLIMCYIIRRCSMAPDASILVMPRRVFPAEAFYSLSRFVARDAQVFSADAWIVGADARPRTPAARLIASRRSASARRHWTLRRCLGPCRLAEAPFGSSRLPDTKAAPRADTKLHESSARYCGYSLPISVFVAESGMGRKRASNFSCLFVWRENSPAPKASGCPTSAPWALTRDHERRAVARRIA